MEPGVELIVNTAPPGLPERLPDELGIRAAIFVLGHIVKQRPEKLRMKMLQSLAHSAIFRVNTFKDRSPELVDGVERIRGLSICPAG
jgi:hypothetical protein